MAQVFFAGAENPEDLKLLVSAGVKNFLVTFWHIRKKGYRWFEKNVLDNLPQGAQLFVDSGAYSAMQKGIQLKDAEEYVEEYADFLRRIKNHVFVAAEFDIDTEVGVKRVYKWQADVFKPLENDGIRICYVWHPERGHGAWNKMCEEHEYVGFNEAALPSVGQQISMVRKAGQSGAVVHGFAMTKFEVLAKVPFYTVDSTTWLVGRKYAEINVWNGRTIQRIRKHQFRGHFAKMKRLGVDIQKIRDEDSTERNRASILSFLEAEKKLNERTHNRQYWLTENLNASGFLPNERGTKKKLPLSSDGKTPSRELLETGLALGDLGSSPKRGLLKPRKARRKIESTPKIGVQYIQGDYDLKAKKKPLPSVAGLKRLTNGKKDARTPVKEGLALVPRKAKRKRGYKEGRLFYSEEPDRKPIKARRRTKSTEDFDKDWDQMMERNRKSLGNWDGSSAKTRTVKGTTYMQEPDTGLWVAIYGKKVKKKGVVIAGKTFYPDKDGNYDIPVQYAGTDDGKSVSLMGAGTKKKSMLEIYKEQSDRVSGNVSKLHTKNGIVRRNDKNNRGNNSDGPAVEGRAEGKRVAKHSSGSSLQDKYDEERAKHGVTRGKGEDKRGLVGGNSDNKRGGNLSRHASGNNNKGKGLAVIPKGYTDTPNSGVGEAIASKAISDIMRKVKKGRKLDKAEKQMLTAVMGAGISKRKKGNFHGYKHGLYTKRTGKLHCDNCYVSATCPKFSAGSLCAFEKDFKHIKVRNTRDAMETVKAVISVMGERASRALFMEMMDGGLPTRETSTLLESLATWSERFIALRRGKGKQDPAEQLNISGGPGLLGKIFSGHAQKGSDKEEEVESLDLEIQSRHDELPDPSENDKGEQIPEEKDNG